MDTWKFLNIKKTHLKAFKAQQIKETVQLLHLDPTKKWIQHCHGNNHTVVVM